MGTRAGIYTRISEDKLGDEHGVTNQLTEAERLAGQRVFTVVARFSDNDISALRGKYRPGYAALMAAVRAGELDVIVLFQSSRLWRNRAERAADIKILQDAAVSVVAVQGPSLDCSTAQGRAMAGLLGEFDTMESEIKGERQQMANRQAAMAGRRRADGRGSFGYLRDHVTPHPDEGAAVAAAVAAIVAGGSVTEITREWERAGLRPPQAPFGPLREHAWTRASVRAILLNPVIAAQRVYKGDIVAEGTWTPLVSREQWEACRAILEDKGRKPSKAVRTLLGNMALCQCGQPTLAGVNHLGTHIYRCLPERRAPGSGPHVARVAADVDRFVTEVIIARLSRDDAADLLPQRQHTDVAALSGEANAIRARRDELGAMFAAGDIGRAALLAGTERANRRLTEIDTQLAEAGRESAVAPLAAAADARQVWDTLDLSRRRAVISALMTIRLLSPGRGRRGFDPDTVAIEWKTP